MRVARTRARRRVWLGGWLAVIATALLALTGCGSAAEPSVGQASSPGDAATEAAQTPMPAGSSNTSTSDVPDPDGIENSASDGRAATSGQSPATTASSTPSDPSAPSSRESPPAYDFPHETSVPVTATVNPQCIVRGAAATLTVETEPRSAVAWHARYTGDEGGADEPYGQGHGGNDKGTTDPKGHYSSRWTVSSDAPVGPARVDVVVGKDGEWGFDDPMFRIVDRPADC